MDNVRYEKKKTKDKRPNKEEMKNDQQEMKTKFKTGQDELKNENWTRRNQERNNKRRSGIIKIRKRENKISQERLIDESTR